MKLQDLQRNHENQYDKITADYKRAWMEKVARKQESLEEQGITTNTLYDRVEAVKNEHRKRGIVEISTYDALAQILDYERRPDHETPKKTEEHIL